MNTRSGSTDGSKSARKRTGRVLAMFSVMALTLAASPTALAAERGRPGSLSVKEAHLDQFFHVLRSQLRSVSWTD